MRNDGTERLIAVGDVHGRYDLLRRLLEEVIGFKPGSDALVFMGDYIDRGFESRQVVEFVDTLRGEFPDTITLLAGNHEDMARKALSSGRSLDMQLWLLNGGDATIVSFGGVDEAAEVLLPFIDSLVLYFETETHIFVHGGVSPHLEPALTPPEVLLWSRTGEAHSSGKTVVVGHSVHREVTFYDGVVAIDTGAFYTNVLSAYDVLNHRVYST